MCLKTEKKKFLKWFESHHHMVFDLDNGGGDVDGVEMVWERDEANGRKCDALDAIFFLL